MHSTTPWPLLHWQGQKQGRPGAVRLLPYIPEHAQGMLHPGSVCDFQSPCSASHSLRFHLIFLVVCFCLILTRSYMAMKFFGSWKKEFCTVWAPFQARHSLSSGIFHVPGRPGVRGSLGRDWKRLAPSAFSGIAAQLTERGRVGTRANQNATVFCAIYWAVLLNKYSWIVACF